MQINSNERIIRANISESELNLLKINQNISVTSSDNTQFTSKIKEISNIPSKIKKWRLILRHFTFYTTQSSNWNTL